MESSTLPVHMGGLGVSVCMLAPSAFLASAAATLPLQDVIFAGLVQNIEDHTVTEAEYLRMLLMVQANTTFSTETSKHIQKAWDMQITAAMFQRLSDDDSNTSTDMARLREADAPHSGDLLHVPPVTVVGLSLSDDAIRIAVSYCPGCAMCQPYFCVFSAMVNKTGLHGLLCKKNVPRYIRQAQLNDIILRAVKRAQYPSVKEPVGLSCSDGKSPDGATLIPWARGKPFAWDSTIADMYAISYVGKKSGGGRRPIHTLATRAAVAADQAASSKTAKCTELSKTHHFTPIAIETCGSWNDLAIEFITEFGKRIAVLTQEPRECSVYFRVALQRGNVVAFQNTFPAEH